jgi:hypothetical protein
MPADRDHDDLLSATDVPAARPATGNLVKVPRAQPLDRRHGVMSERPIRCAKVHDAVYGIDGPLTKLGRARVALQALDGCRLPVRARHGARAKQPNL